MGKSLDLNGTTVLIACLFWGFLWGLVGLILAMPITASIKLVFEEIPNLKTWADLMSNEKRLNSASPQALETPAVKTAEVATKEIALWGESAK